MCNMQMNDYPDASSTALQQNLMGNLGDNPLTVNDPQWSEYKDMIEQAVYDATYDFFTNFLNENFANLNLSLEDLGLDQELNDLSESVIDAVPVSEPAPLPNTGAGDQSLVVQPGPVEMPLTSPVDSSGTDALTPGTLVDSQGNGSYNPNLFQGTSSSGNGAFEVGGETFSHAVWASGSGFMSNEFAQADLKEYVDAAKAADQTAQVVVYGLGDINGGSAQEVGDYQEYIETLSNIIGDAKAELYFEPDMSGLHPEKLTSQQILDAVSYLEANNPNAKILLDTSHSNWLTDLSDKIPAYRSLMEAGADGFVGNVSNYRPTEELAEWMHSELYSEFGDSAIYAIDTSRNGAGLTPQGVQNGEWADVEGAGIGEKAGGSLEYQGMDLMFRHVKPATEADVTPYPGAQVSQERLQSLFDNSIYA